MGHKSKHFQKKTGENLCDPRLGKKFLTPPKVPLKD